MSVGQFTKSHRYSHAFLIHSLTNKTPLFLQVNAHSMRLPAHISPVTGNELHSATKLTRISSSSSSSQVPGRWPWVPW